MEHRPALGPAAVQPSREVQAGGVVAERPAHRLGPEPADVGPGCPRRGPPEAVIGRDRHAPAEAVPPAGQDGVPSGAREGNVCERLRSGGDVSANRWWEGETQERRPGAAPGEGGGLLDDKRPDGHHRLGGEDLGHAVEILGDVRPSPTPPGQGPHELDVGVPPDRDRAHGDLVPSQGRGDAAKVARVGQAVAEDDDVLDLGRGTAEEFPRGPERRGHHRAAPGFEPRDLLEHTLTLARFGWGDQPAIFLIEGDHADLVVLAQQIDDRGGDLLGQCLLGELRAERLHAPRRVDDEHDGDGGERQRLADVHRHGQRLFERRPGVPANAVAVAAPNHDEASAHRLDERPNALLLPLAQVERRDVVEDHAPVRGKSDEGLGHVLGCPDIDPEPLVAEPLGEPARARGHEEDARPVTDDHQGLPVVVLGNRVGRRHDVDAVPDDPAPHRRL